MDYSDDAVIASLQITLNGDVVFQGRAGSNAPFELPDMEIEG